MRLVRVAELEREMGQIGGGIVGEAVGRLDEPVALDDPLRRHPDVFTKQALQLTGRNGELAGDLLDLGDLAIRCDSGRDPPRQFHRRVGRRTKRAEEELDRREYLLVVAPFERFCFQAVDRGAEHVSQRPASVGE